jgi:hypothetical protein
MFSNILLDLVEFDWFVLLIYSLILDDLNNDIVSSKDLLSTIEDLWLDKRLDLLPKSYLSLTSPII